MKPDMPNLLTPKYLSELLGFHVVTVRLMLASGEFGPYVRVGRRLLLERRVLEEWIERHRVAGVSPRAKGMEPKPKPEFVELLRGGKSDR